MMADLDLFGCWKTAPSCGVDLPCDDPLAEAVRAVVLETKSAESPHVSSAGALRQLLNEMTVEIRGQFDSFRKMRTAAELLLQGDDETAQKLARADIKAATDAMSLIVRTLEKIDSLQRQLARDRQDEAERAADAGGYGEAKARFIQMIKDRANETALRLYEQWKRDGPPEWALERLGRQAGEQADEKAGGGGGGEKGGRGFDGDGLEL